MSADRDVSERKEGKITESREGGERQKRTLQISKKRGNDGVKRKTQEMRDPEV